MTEQQQDAEARQTLRESLKRKIIIERIAVSYCKQCKAAFGPRRASSRANSSAGSDDEGEGEDEEEEEEDEFCSRFCREQSEAGRGRERKLRELSSSGGPPGESRSGSAAGSQDGLVVSSDGQEKDVDGGYAWIILAVMFIINASTYGTARAYGLIFERVAREGGQSRTMAALPFNVMGALENLGGPLAGYLLAKSSWRVTVFLGSCLITLAHLLASFSELILLRLLTMGLMCGLGLSLVSISSFNINNAYFNKYRSRAFGFCLTGAAVGTFYISPLCEFVLDEYSVAHCYLLLAFILFPNVPLSLLLKPKRKPTSELTSGVSEIMTSTTIEPENSNREQQNETNETLTTKVYVISKESIKRNKRDKKRKAKESQPSLATSVKVVISTPMFHLIWTTQLLFCWLNFVFGMIIVDFGKDRGLDDDRATDLVLIWAFGQLAGRLGLGFLVDIKLVSYRTFTIICFLFISLTTWCMGNVSIENYQDYVIYGTVFVLSMWIAVLYILFNGLTVEYMDKSVSAFTVGISSFIGSFLLFPRANLIGYYRDTMGNYDAMLSLFQFVSLAGALTWLLVPWMFAKLRACYLNSLERRLSPPEASQPETAVVVVGCCSNAKRPQIPSIVTSSPTTQEA